MPKIIKGTMTGPELQGLRKNLGLSRQKLADKLGVSLSKIVDYESGIKRGTDRPAYISRSFEIAIKKLAQDLKEEIIDEKVCLNKENLTMLLAVVESTGCIPINTALELIRLQNARSKTS